MWYVASHFMIGRMKLYNGFTVGLNKLGFGHRTHQVKAKNYYALVENAAVSDDSEYVALYLGHGSSIQRFWHCTNRFPRIRSSRQILCHQW